MNKEKITETLKVLETELHEKKLELKRISKTLEINYQYEDELLDRLETARNKTSEMRNEFFKVSGEISQTLDKMKKEMDIWTGNFYSHLTSKY